MVSTHPLGVSVNLKTTPTIYLPPAWVVPYRLPAASNVTPADGHPPSSPPVKVCNTVSLQVPLPLGVSSQTTPGLFWPWDVPYMFPAASKTGCESGLPSNSEN